MQDVMSQYVPEAIAGIWSPRMRIEIQRMLWSTIYCAQGDVGVHECDEAIIEAMSRATADIDLESIRRREQTTRHDLKASLEEFLHVAAVPEVLHLGCTSADIVDNVSLIQMAMSCNVLGQLTGNELLLAWQAWLPFRGITGPMGTGQDQLDLMGGDQGKYQAFQQMMAGSFGFQTLMISTGQVYHRSVDLMYASNLMLLANDHRATHLLASGYLQMIAGYSGDQWNEGDVSTSVVRRVALPGVTFAAAAAVHGALHEEAKRATEEASPGSTTTRHDGYI